ncbi:hypothetical protein ACWD4V_24085 [Streptomyces tsukubensis]
MPVPSPSGPHAGNHPAHDRLTRLTAWGTFASGVSALVGLLLASIATYAAIQTLRDQQRAEAEDSARQSAAQAVRFTVWTDRVGGSSPKKLYVLNRSPDPVTYWALIYRLDLETSPGEGHTALAEQQIITPIPPCTQLTIDLARINKNTVWKSLSSGKNVQSAEVDAVLFQDAGEQSWTRSVFGFLAKGYPEVILGFHPPHDDAKQAITNSSSSHMCDEAGS